MAMITFEDLPSTNTPLNAANLNNNFSELNSIIGTTSANNGCAKIGKIGIEWGTKDVTSGSTATTSTPFDIYTGSGTVNFVNTYKKAPMIQTQIVGSYYNCIATYFSLSSTTSCTVGMRMTSASSSRTIGYLVIGELA